MADMGFDIEEDLPRDVSLNIPPFLNGKPQLSLHEELETRRIASVRVHAQRAIARIKNFQSEMLKNGDAPMTSRVAKL